MSKDLYFQDILFPKTFKTNYVIIITSVFDSRQNIGHTNVVKFSLTNFHDNFTEKSVLYAKDFRNCRDMLKNHKRLVEKHETKRKNQKIFLKY